MGRGGIRGRCIGGGGGGGRWDRGGGGGGGGMPPPRVAMANRNQNNNFMDADLGNQANTNAMRNEIFNREQFQHMESTSEYMETHYYDSKVIGGADACNHVDFNLFWSDYAQFLIDDTKTQFVTENFTSMTGQAI